MGFFTFLKQHPELIWVFFAFGLPLLARILKKLGEQSRKRDAAIRKQQDELERLRTGGVTPIQQTPPPPQASARATLEEMAARRRAQIEELRQRRAAQAAGRPVPTPTPTPTSQSPAPVRREPSRQVTQPQVRMPSQQDVQRQRANQEARAREQKQRELRAREQAERKARQQAQREKTARPVRTEPAPLPPAPEMQPARELPPAREFSPMKTAAAAAERRPAAFSKSEWRRAIVMREILAAPISMRS